MWLCGSPPEQRERVAGSITNVAHHIVPYSGMWHRAVPFPRRQTGNASFAGELLVHDLSPTLNESTDSRSQLTLQNIVRLLIEILILNKSIPHQLRNLQFLRDSETLSSQNSDISSNPLSQGSFHTLDALNNSEMLPSVRQRPLRQWSIVPSF